MLSLDVGCGHIVDVHKKRGDIGIDIHRGICDVVADVCSIPFKNDAFDRISICSVLEHLDDPIKCLKECLRVAEDGADFEIIFPVESREYLVELKRMVLEFPFGVWAVLMERYQNHKYKPPPHVNRIQPRHISRLLNIREVKVEGNHAWFQGHKGRLLRRISKNPPIGGWKDWRIKATKPS